MDAPKYRAGDEIAGTRYVFVSTLGEGGQGVVYLVRHPFLDVLRVMKLVHAHLAERTDVNLQDEARALAKIDHPGIVPVLEGGISAERQPRPFFVMPRLEGDTLHSVLRRRRTGIPVRHAIDMAIELLDGLDVAHNEPHNLIHRDIKPGNIFMSRISPTKTVAVLLDFGIAKLIEHAGRNTQRGFVGTWEYAAPEQLQGRPTTQSDLYNIGLVLYETIAGQHPFKAFCNQRQDYAEAHLRRVPPRLSSLGTVPKAVDEVVHDALAKDPAQRPKNAHEFARVLRAIKLTLDLEHRRPKPDKTDEEPLEQLWARMGITPGSESEVAPIEVARPYSTPLWGSQVSRTDPRAPVNDSARRDARDVIPTAQPPHHRGSTFVESRVDDGRPHRPDTAATIPAPTASVPVPLKAVPAENRVRSAGTPRPAAGQHPGKEPYDSSSPMLLNARRRNAANALLNRPAGKLLLVTCGLFAATLALVAIAKFGRLSSTPVALTAPTAVEVSAPSATTPRLPVSASLPTPAVIDTVAPSPPIASVEVAPTATPAAPPRRVVPDDGVSLRPMPATLETAPDAATTKPKRPGSGLDSDHSLILEN